MLESISMLIINILSEVGQESGAREYLQIIDPLYSVNLNSKVMIYINKIIS